MSTMLLTTLTALKPNQAVAETVLSCNIISGSQNLTNNAIASYNNHPSLNSASNKTNIGIATGSSIQINNLGIVQETGELVSALSIISGGLLAEYQQQGFSIEEANQAVLDTISTWAQLSADATSATVIASIKQSLLEKFGSDQAELINQLSDSSILTALAGLTSPSLETLGFSPEEIATVTQTAITPQTEGSFSAQIQTVIASVVSELSRPEAQAQLSALPESLAVELEQIRQGTQTPIASGSVLSFRFSLDNTGTSATSIELPNIQTLTESGLVGAGEVIGVTFGFPGEAEQTLTDTGQSVLIPAGQTLTLSTQVRVGETAEKEITSIGLNLQSGCGEINSVQSINLVPSIVVDDDPNSELIDPRGQVSGCAGELLADYLGFSVALFEVNSSDPTLSEPAGLTLLTTTELPDDPNNNVPAGITPNTQNSNPFFLTNEDEGQYSFLFDDGRGQLELGRNYILVVEPPDDSTFNQRQVRLTIGERQGDIVEYVATSLDGRPISAESEDTTVTGQIVLVEDAERIGLNLAVLDLSADICDAEEISITKTADRASAEPGDIVLYRIAVQNLATSPLTNFQITDRLPPGFSLEGETVLGEVNSNLVEIETTLTSERVVNFSANTTLEQGESLTLVYAAKISPDALRGEAENSATVNAQRNDNNQIVQDGPAVYRLNLESGIIRDAGILIGRVFVDHNFDGEQQSGEPGVPNAVIYLENGNRIITDADGLFSVSNMLPGYHTGVLDLTSIPEYELAPNLRFIERNSSSRLVNLAPGGLVRMNFAVTPTAAEETPEADSETSVTPDLQK
ncbi:MAG: isopeptide-forming domain-containing fimbrial protein [Cyanobacteria bacterium J06621_8]